MGFKTTTYYLLSTLYNNLSKTGSIYAAVLPVPDENNK